MGLHSIVLYSSGRRFGSGFAFEFSHLSVLGSIPKTTLHAIGALSVILVQRCVSQAERHRRGLSPGIRQLGKAQTAGKSCAGSRRDTGRGRGSITEMMPDD